MLEKRRLVMAAAVLLVIPFFGGVGAAQLQQSFNSTYDWNNALDWSGVAWDGIQDHSAQPTLQQGYQYGSLTEGLVGYWSFEEKTPRGPTDRALSNNGTFNGDNDGTLNNFGFNKESGWTEDAKRGKHALEFDGKDDYVDVPDNDKLDISGEITFASWIRLEEVGKERFGVWDSDNGHQQCYRFGTGGGSDWEFILRNETTHDFYGVGGGTPVQGKWFHVTGTRSGSTMKMYVNGEQVDSRTDFEGPINTCGRALTIGAESSPLDNFVNGSIDDVQVYESALSSSEISKLYKGRSVNRSGLVGEWTFDHGSGTTAFDTSNWKNGKRGRLSGKFDGSDDWVDISGASERISGNSFTASFWAKRGETGEWHVALGGGNSAENEGLHIGFNNNNKFSCRFWADDLDTKNAYTETGIWHHWACSYNNETGDRKIYRDGVQLVSDSSSGVDTHGELYIGQSYGEGSHFNGSLDSVRVYDRALSTQEIKAIYNRNREQRISPQDTLQSGLVGWWPLHETAGNTTQDLSGNNNDGNLYGGSGPTQGVAGRGGLTAYSFDGSDDYVDAGHISDTEGVSDLTVGAWIYPKDVTSDSNNEVIISQDDSSFNDVWRFDIATDGNLHLYLDGASSDTTHFYNLGSIEPKTWQFVLFRYDSGVVSSFVDGQNIRTDASLKGEDLDTTSAPIQIGEGRGTFFNGKIQGVRIYDRALSNQEIDRLYQMGSGDYATPPGDDEGGVAYWSFDHNLAGRTVVDEFGNNDGVLGNSSEFTHPEYNQTKSVRRQGLTFDGNQDFVDTGTKWPANEVTVSTWLYAPSSPSSNFRGMLAALNSTDKKELVFRLMSDMGINWASWDNTGPGYRGFRDYDGANLQAGEWYHIAGTFNGSAYALYVNGKFESRKINHTYYPVRNRNVYIGARNNQGTPDEFLDATLDEVRIYDRALPARKIHDLYQHGTFGRDMRSLTTEQGLVGYWSLDENSGQTVYDLSGHGNNGTRGSDSTSESSDPTQGEKGMLGTSAYKFDGSDDFINASASKDWPQFSSFTVSWWMYPDKSLSSEAYIWYHADSNQFNAIQRADDTIDFSLHDGSNWNSLKGHSIPIQSWSMFTMTWDGSTFTAYKNGVEINSTSAGSMNLGNSDFILGAHHTAGQQFWSGKLDELRIYNRSLTPAEVQSLYSTSQHGEMLTEWEAGGPVQPDLFRTDWSRPDAPGASNLVGAWRLNEDHGSSSSGDTVKDWSGNGNDGTTNNGVDTNLDGAFAGSSSYYFDSSNNEYVESNKNINIGGTDTRTLSFWAKKDNPGSAAHPVNWGSASNGQAFGFWLNSGESVYFYGHSGSYDYDTGADISDGWNHYTVVYDGNKVWTYLNGKATPTTGVSRSLNTDGSTTLKIGTRPDVTNSWDGYIDDVRIYDTALSNASIRSLYHTSTVTADAIGSQGTAAVERNDQDVPYPDGHAGGPKTYDLDWSQPHENVRVSTTFNTTNITKAPSLSSVGLNASEYTPSTTDQWSTGFSSGVSADDGMYGGGDGEIRFGQGNWSDESLVAHYTFEPKNPGNVTDVSGSGNTGTFYNNEKNGTLNNFDFDADSGWVSGKQGSHALQFDGDNDRIDVDSLDISTGGVT